MSTIVFPPADDEPWPTLGPDVCAFIEENLCHGPGDLLGASVQLDDEQRAWIFRMYEVERPYHERRKNKTIVHDKNPRAGKRRFERCVLSLRKGSNKTELAAFITAVELHDEGPVRCDGFRKGRGGILVPIGRPVTDPYIPMISYTEEQTEELAYGALRRILEISRIAGDFDIGLERIMRASGDGKAEAVSASPNARDGARTTFQHADETHRFTLDHLRSAWRVMLANLGKRPIADPWALETTTAPEPGAGSTADATMEHARKVREHGEPAKSRLFFFHRQAADVHKTDTDVGLRAAIVEASGPFIAKWTDVDRILARFREPDADLPYLERVYLNRPVQAVQRAFDVNRWRELVKRGLEIPDGDEITIGFDGSRFDDATGLVATHILTGYQWPLGVWEKPSDTPSGPTRWEVEADQVSGVVDDAFTRWSVIRMYCDPEKWEQTVAHWAGQYGATRVLEWWTNRRRPMAYAIRSYCSAISAGELSHNGDPVFERHIGNSYRMPTNLVDEEKKPLWILRKERPDSEKKIDLAMAGVLSWEARNDALAAGHGAGSGWLMAAIQRK